MYLRSLLLKKLKITQRAKMCIIRVTSYRPWHESSWKHLLHIHLPFSSSHIFCLALDCTLPIKGKCTKIILLERTENCISQKECDYTEVLYNEGIKKCHFGICSKCFQTALSLTLLTLLQGCEGDGSKQLCQYWPCCSLD